MRRTTATRTTTPRGSACTGVVFRGTTDYLTLKAGTYQVRFVAAGTSRVLLDSTPYHRRQRRRHDLRAEHDSGDGRSGADARGRRSERSSAMRGGGRPSAASGSARSRATARSRTRRSTNMRRPAGVLRKGRSRAARFATGRCVFAAHQGIPLMRAASRLLCRAALLRWTICLLTSESMTGTAAL